MLDALGNLEPEPFEGRVWRAVRDGRLPLEGSSARGRWSPGHFDVVYTSLDPDGARAELYFHLTRQPVFPSRLRYWLYELNVKSKETLRLATTEPRLGLGVGRARAPGSIPGGSAGPLGVTASTGRPGFRWSP